MNALRMISSPLILTPAYGRTYSTEQELLADWNAGEDFKVKAGPYCSIRDLDELLRGSSSLWCIDLISRLNVKLG